MSFSVVTNLSSIAAQSMLGSARSDLSQALHQLTSGSRINSSADDAAGLARANRYRLDNTSHTVGMRNANDAVSQLQIEDGALSNISSLMDRATTLARQAASGTFTGDRAILNEEFQSVMAEITRTAAAAGLETGGTNLDSRKVFVGNSQTNTSDSVSYVSVAANDSVDTVGLGIDSQNILSQADAAAAISNLQDAVGTLGACRELAPSKQESTTYEPSLVCKLLIHWLQISYSRQAPRHGSGPNRIRDEPVELCRSAIPADFGQSTGFGISYSRRQYR